MGLLPPTLAKTRLGLMLVLVTLEKFLLARTMQYILCQPWSLTQLRATSMAQNGNIVGTMLARLKRCGPDNWWGSYGTELGVGDVESTKTGIAV